MNSTDEDKDKLELASTNSLRRIMGMSMLSYKHSECMNCKRAYIAQYSGERKIIYLCSNCRKHGYSPEWL